MEITKLGQSCFRLKGRRATILIDPPPELKDLTAHILILSSKKGKASKARGEPVLIFGPGEYEIREVRIFGTKEKGKRVYKIEIDGLSLLYLGGLQEKMSEEKVETLNQVDILFLSTGEPKAASTLVSQLEPLIVIPMEEKGVEDFLKEEGVGKVERLSKFTITKEELSEERRIVVLKEM